MMKSLFSRCYRLTLIRCQIVTLIMTLLTITAVFEINRQTVSTIRLLAASKSTNDDVRLTKYAHSAGLPGNNNDPSHISSSHDKHQRHEMNAVDRGAQISGGVTKVIAMTYMRSGSTFLGQILDQNEKSFYWFEPMDGVFSHLYGTLLGRLPIDITQYLNGSDRSPPEFEREAFLSSAHNLLNCEFDKVPIEVTTHDTCLLRLKASAPEYIKCLNDGVEKLKASHKPYKIHNCKQTFQQQCMDFPNLELCHNRLFNNTLAMEYTNLTYKMKVLTNDQQTRKLTGNRAVTQYRPRLTQYRPRLTRNNKSSYQKIINERVLDPYKSHYSCVQNFKEIYITCSSKLIQRCSNSTIRAFKTIRMTMANIEDLLAVDPTIRILYLVRDPRAIAHSRVRTGLTSRAVGKFSKTASEKIKNEAILICHKMRNDLKIRTTLEQKYPYNFLEIKYEEMALKPVDIYKDVYSFLNLELSENVEKWINTTIHSGKDNGSFGILRKNATETAFKWETDIYYRTVKIINEQCKDILNRFGYLESYSL